VNKLKSSKLVPPEATADVIGLGPSGRRPLEKSFASVAAARSIRLDSPPLLLLLLLLLLLPPLPRQLKLLAIEDDGALPPPSSHDAEEAVLGERLGVPVKSLMDAVACAGT
jgi:hypothetical protein